MKKIRMLLVGCITLLLFNNKVNAAYSLSTNKSKIYNGDSFTTIVSLNGVAAWEVHVSASGPVSGCSINAADATENALNGSKTYSVSCKSTGVGIITLKLTGNTTTENDQKNYLSGSKTVSVVEKPVSKPTTKPATTTKPTTNNSGNKNSSNNKSNKKNDKSSNNYLKELNVDNYEISPKFDKNKTEYSISVPNEVSKIKINAWTESNKADLSGDGEKEVKEGNNEFKIKVKAENGEVKEYIIKVLVESKPIEVIVDNKKYTLIKDKELLPELKFEHEDLKLTINETEIPAYRIDKINFVLVGLKDENNNINLFKFDSEKADLNSFKYTSFDYINNIVLLKLDKSKIPENYKKYTETIDEKDVIVYKLNKNSKYSLIYGINVETGKENVYKYDKNENTLQIFEREEQKLLEEEIEKYQKLIMILGGAILVLILLVTIGFTRKPKQKEVIKEENIDTEFLTKKELKKIEKENKKLNKKIKNKEEA